MIRRHVCEAVFRGVVSRCRPEHAVRSTLRAQPLHQVVYGIALGDAALSMIRGAGPVLHGVAITRDDDRAHLPSGWHVVAPDETAELLILDIVASVREEAELIVLLSGGAEQIVTPALSGGRLAELSSAPVRTLIASNLEGDALETLGGAPTVPVRSQDRASVVVPRDAIVGALGRELGRHFSTSVRVGPQVTTERVATKLVGDARSSLEPHYYFNQTRFEPPASAGAAGPAQLLALQLALELRGHDLSAFCAASTGWDGPALVGHPRPAGAFVDGTTWDAMHAANLDPAGALARHDAGPALRAIGALVITHFTGIDHGGDIVIVG